MNNSIAIDAGATAWVMMCTALLFLLVFGLQLFYAGRVRQRYVVAFCFMSLQWVLWGYSLSFGPQGQGSMGGLAWAALRYVGMDPNADVAPGIPHNAFMAFQGLVAFIPVVLLMAACGERIKASAIFVFLFFWTSIVYAPVTHWMAAPNGFLKAGGAVSGAGAISVHWCMGLSAWVVSSVLRRYRDEGDHRRLESGASLLSPLGAVLVWVGWWGWVGGTGLLADGHASSAIVSTQIAAASAGLMWLALDRMFDARLTVQGMLSGIVAGLVASSAMPLPVGGSLVTGVGAAATVYATLALWKNRWGADDSIDLFGVHAIGALWGILIAGLWSLRSADAALGAASVAPSIPLGVEMKALVSVALYSVLVTWVLLKVIVKTIGVRQEIRHN